MYSFTISVEVGATAARVWRALCDPSEVVQWDTGVLEALDAPPDYPQPGQHVRWRYSNGPFRGFLHDRPQEVVPERTLRTHISFAGGWLEETFRLTPAGARTRVGLLMRVRAPLPLLGWLLERLYLGSSSRKTMMKSFAALKKHCEASP